MSVIYQARVALRPSLRAEARILIPGVHGVCLQARHRLEAGKRSSIAAHPIRVLASGLPASPLGVCTQDRFHDWPGGWFTVDERLISSGNFRAVHRLIGVVDGLGKSLPTGPARNPKGSRD